MPEWPDRVERAIEEGSEAAMRALGDLMRSSEAPEDLGVWVRENTAFKAPNEVLRRIIFVVQRRAGLCLEVAEGTTWACHKAAGHDGMHEAIHPLARFYPETVPWRMTDA